MQTRTSEMMGCRGKLMVWAAGSVFLLVGCALDYGDEVLYEEGEKEEVEEVAHKANFYTPVGTHDVANCTRIAGWAKDGDTTAPIQVHIYKGAPFPWGTHVVNVVADRYRADLPFADKNHGFRIDTPAAFKTGFREKVYIHAIDYTTAGVPNPPGVGNNVLLNSTGKTVCCGSYCNLPPPPPPCAIDCPPDVP